MDYLTYVAPGLLAYAAFMTAVFQALFAAFIRMRYQRTWEGQLTTQVELRHVVWGEVLWAALLATIYVLIVALVLALFALAGLVEPRPRLAAPSRCRIAFVGGCGFAAFGLCFTALVPTIDHMNLPVFLVVIPMGLLSGTYFPITHPAARDPVGREPAVSPGAELPRAPPGRARRRPPRQPRPPVPADGGPAGAPRPPPAPPPRPGRLTPARPAAAGGDLDPRAATDGSQGVVKLAGKVALVTGAARGIGRGIALALAGEGVHVAAADLGGRERSRRRLPARPPGRPRGDRAEPREPRRPGPRHRRRRDPRRRRPPHGRGDGGGARRARHRGEQRRRPGRRAVRSAHRGAVRPHDGGQRQGRRAGDPGRPARAPGAGRRRHREHRLDLGEDRPRLHRGLRRVEVRRRRAHPGPGPRVRPRQHPGQRGVPRPPPDHHVDGRGRARPRARPSASRSTRRSTPSSARRRPSGASRRPRTSARRSSTSAAPRTSPASRSTSPAASRCTSLCPARRAARQRDDIV